MQTTSAYEDQVLQYECEKEQDCVRIMMVSLREFRYTSRSAGVNSIIVVRRVASTRSASVPLVWFNIINMFVDRNRHDPDSKEGSKIPHFMKNRKPIRFEFHHDCAISSCQVIALHLIKLVLDFVLYFVVQVVGDFHFIEDDRKVYDQVQVVGKKEVRSTLLKNRVKD